MECYGSSSPPCGAKLKSTPEDFVVEEALAGLDVSQSRGSGYVPLYRIEKRGIDTIHMERELGEVLRSRVRTAGMKDKVAVAVQYATPTSSRSDAPESVLKDNFSARLVGFVPRPLSRGSIIGNRFKVVLRDCCPDILDRVNECYALAGRSLLPNFFGLQRFGGRGLLTHRVGKSMVLKKFDEAVRLLLVEPRSSDGPDSADARVAMGQGDFETGARTLPPGQDLEKGVARRLALKPGDSVGALRAVPIKVRKLYTQAFQSYLFNRTLSAALVAALDISGPEAGDNWGELGDRGLTLSKAHGAREAMGPGAVPLVQLAGYAYRDYGSRFDRCAGQIMEEEGVSARDFYIKEMEEVSVEGGFRRPALSIADPESAREGDNTSLGFTLGRGSYATVLVREIVKPADPVAAGFA